MNRLMGLSTEQQDDDRQGKQRCDPCESKCRQAGLGMVSAVMLVTLMVLIMLVMWW